MYATFSGSDNRGVQVGYNAGNVETHHHYPRERPETPPSPSLLIPFLRDPDFVYRGTILNQLYQRRAPGSRTAFVGFGGVGKSQLAIEYAYQTYKQSPETWVFWVHASNAARFEQSYQEIADTVKLFGRRNPKGNIFKLVHDWLRNSKNGKWVLILDNVDDADFLDVPYSSHGHNGQPLREYLPQCPNGSILITSRSSEAALKLVEQRDIIRVEPMDEAHALSLFEKKLGEQGNHQEIIELAAALEFIPLAIVQAAAYISDPDRGCSVRQYLNEFQKSDRKKLSLLDHQGGQLRRDWEAKNSVFLTWQISFDQIRQTRRSAADLLSLMSFFDRQGIPEALLQDRTKQEAAQQSDGDDDDDSESQSSVTDEFKDDILMLRRYLLISIGIDRTTFEMHSLVQLATRKWLKVNGELEKWKQQYIKNLNSDFPSGEYKNWEKCQALFPHAKSAATQRPQEQESLIEWASVLYKAAWYDWRKGNGAEGEKLSVMAMKARTNFLGQEHKETLSSMEMVGVIYLLKGRWKEAEEMFVQVMETRKRVLGAEHPDTLISMANLASTYWNQGRWKGAEELFVQVMETGKRVLGAEHPSTLSSMANLASTYRNLGRWEEAEALDVQVMETRKRVLGAEHPSTLTSMGNLASTYRNQGRWKEAEEMFVQVIETSKRVLGVEHPSTLSSIANLASTYRNQGRWKEAEALEMQVMEMTERVLGAEHPSTLTSMTNLASTYRNQGRWEEAEALDVQVMEMRERVLGAEHPDTLISMANLASTYRNQGRWKEAEALEVQVMETRKRVLGVEHPNTLTSMGNLVFTWKTQGRGADALNLMKDCVQLQTKILSANHPTALASSATLIRWQMENLNIGVLAADDAV